MASCAVCELPIVRGQRFLLDGTEVFHAACASNSYRSKLSITTAKLRETEARLEDTRRAAARTEVELNVQRNLATSRHAEVVQLEYSVSQARAQQAAHEQARFEVEAQLRAARAEIAVLKADAAARSSENRQVADPAQDDSALRFSLLELDAE